MNLLSIRSNTRYIGSAMLCGTFILGGCSKGEKPADTAMAANSAPSDSSGAMSGMAGSASKMTGHADHDFLRMMSDHHQGLISIVHMTIERKDIGSSLADAKKLDDAQDKELDKMVTMLEKDYKDPYEPKIMAEHQAMADALKPKTGKEYDRGFYQSIIMHHEEAIKMGVNLFVYAVTSRPTS